MRKDPVIFCEKMIETKHRTNAQRFSGSTKPNARKVLWFFLPRKNRSFRKVGKENYIFAHKGENKQKKQPKKLFAREKARYCSKEEQ